MTPDDLVGNIGRALLAEENDNLPAHVQAGLAVAVVAVVAIAGVMSGLTLGLLSMDRLDLELMLRTGSTQQERLARRLEPIIAHPHWVLSTLVICNTAAGMALPLCLDRLVNVAVALVLSTTAIVVFGEILPQAVCSRYGLSIGGHAAPVVRLLMWMTAPVSWPIGKGLDWMLGKEQPVFGKRQISALVDLHRESAGMGGPLNEEEAHVIQGVLDLSSKTGNKAMTPLDKVFMLSTDDVMDRPTLKRILDSGHSRVPVYRSTRTSDIIGLILVKELLAVVGLLEPGSGPVKVKQLRIRDLPALPLETPMTDLLNLFQTGHSHMALLLQKQEDPAKDTTTPTITAHSCSSSSEGGSPSHAHSQRAGSPAAAGKPSRVASLLRSISSKTLGRSKSGKRKEGVQVAVEDAAAAGKQIQQQVGAAAAAAAAAEAADLMEAGVLGHSVSAYVQDVAPAAEAPAADTAAAAAGAAVMPHSASAPGINVTPGTPSEPSGPRGTTTTAAATAAAAAAVTAAVLGKGSGGLGRPSAASLWREAGWDAAGGVPVGIITLEDVLEELMQEEIVDETDAFIDNEKTCRVNARVLAMSLPPGLRRLLVTSQQLQQQRQINQQTQQLAAAAAAAAATLASAAGSLGGHANAPLAGFGSSPALVGASSGGSGVGLSNHGAGSLWPGGVRGRSSVPGA